MPKAQAIERWWLESGRERCSSCGHTYVYETGYYCAVCDSGLCSICVEVAIASEVYCGQCVNDQSVEA